MSAIFDQMLSRYEIRTTEDKQNAMHEVMQQITLAALYRAGFFNEAAFYGGTCLRIFHKLPRFSEDMDFSLLKRDDNFSLEKYFEVIVNEFNALGRDVFISKNNETVLPYQDYLPEKYMLFCSETGKAGSRGVTGMISNGIFAMNTN